MSDKSEVLEGWFDTCKNEDGNVTRVAVARLFVKVGFARDFETAATMLDHRLVDITDEKILSYSDYMRCFMLAIFKESLVSKLNEIQNDTDIGLDLKLSNYKRKLKMQGITKLKPQPVTEANDLILQEQKQSVVKTGHTSLHSLKLLKLPSEPERFNYQNYGKFLKDPMG